MATKDILVPDIGDFDEVEIIEVLVSVGDEINAEDSLITVESDKASMEIPSTDSGIVLSIAVNVGDKISEGSTVLSLDLASADDNDAPNADAASDSAPAPDTPAVDSKASATAETPKAEPETPTPRQARTSPTAAIDEVTFNKAYASPSVRRFARELGVDLGQVNGSGRKGRVVREDVKSHIKEVMSRPQSKASGHIGLGIAPMPEIDFSQWGDIEEQSLSKINRITGDVMHRNWVSIPHITQNDEADITTMDKFRNDMGAEYKEQGIKITPLAFIMKAVVATLKAYPRFNSSLSVDGQSLIMKHYFHIGVAVDTPDGLVVPVIRDVDKKSVIDISQELREAAGKARNKKLKPSDMQGGCFTISSLGGIGGSHFTPIINAPEVAILGVSRSETKPVWDGKKFKPRLIMPFSLSYDHRVIDGADGARFTTHLAKMLSDIRRLLL